MLIITLLYTNTSPKSYRKVEEFDFDVFSVEIAIEKEQKKVKNVFKTNVLVPKTNVIRKGEGATVAASHLPSLSWLVRQAGRAASPRKPYFTGKPHKIPQMSY